MSLCRQPAATHPPRFRRLWIGWLCLGLLAAGCSQPLTGHLSQSAASPTPSETAGLQPETAPHTAAPSDATAIPEPTHTPAPTLMPQPTASPTLDPALAPIQFAVIGDYGSGDVNAQAVAEMVKGWNPDFILTVGDNNYPVGAYETIDDRIGKFYASYINDYQGSFGPGSERMRFFPTLGNHDADTQDGQPYLDYFTLPNNARYYDFTWGPVHFFALNCDWREPDGVGRSSLQAQWLKEGLGKSTAPWKIVYGHLSPYSSGYQGSIDWMLWPFAKWGASIYLAGHDHNYERLVVDGFTYVINGLGGGAIYPIEDALAGSQSFYNSQYGAMRVHGNATRLDFEFINLQGEVIDSFSLLQP